MSPTLVNAPDSALKDITARPVNESVDKSHVNESVDKGPLTPGTMSREQAIAGAEGAKVTSIFGSATASGNGTPPSVTPLGSQAPIGTLMSAELVLNIWDSFFPALLVVLLKRMDLAVKKSDLQLTAKEKEVIAPVLEKALATINFQFESPWTALAVTVGFVYGSKLVEKGAIEWLDKKSAKEAEKAAENAPAEMLGKQASQTVEVVNPGSPAYPEELIFRVQKKRKVGRAKAITILNDYQQKGKKFDF